MSLSEGIKLAFEKGLDLVQVTEKVYPPVVKIVDYGKFLYQQKKSLKKSKKKEGFKVVRISFKEGIHDLERKAKEIKEFLEEGCKVRIDLYLKGREKIFKDLAKEKFTHFLGLIKADYKIVQEIKKVPRGLTVLIVRKG